MFVLLFPYLMFYFPFLFFLNLSLSKKSLGHCFYSLLFTTSPPWASSFLVLMPSPVTILTSPGGSLALLQTDS